MLTDGDVHCDYAASRGAACQKLSPTSGHCLHRFRRQTTWTGWTDYLHGLREREEVCLATVLTL